MQFIQALAARDGKQDIPGDIVDFMRSGQVLFFDEQGQQVKLCQARVLWK